MNAKYNPPSLASCFASVLLYLYIIVFVHLALFEAQQSQILDVCNTL